MKKEKVNAIHGGNSVTSFLKRHSEYIAYLENFITKFPSFKKITEVLAWLQNGVRIKKCIICGKRISYTNSKNSSSLYCSRKCRFNETAVKKAHEKLTKSLQEKYGENVTNIFQVQSVKDKIKKTCLERYNCTNPAKLERFKQKSKDTCIKKYGTEYYSSTERAKNHISKVNKKHGFERLYNRLVKNGFIPLFDIHSYTDTSQKYPFSCQKCGHEYMGNIDDGDFPRCPKCYPKYRSKGEIELYDYVTSLGIKCIMNDRSVISDVTKNKELDIFIPEKKIAIEYDGIFWHNSDRKGKYYHLEKTEACEKKGIHLIHIFEDTWRDKKDIVKARLRHLLGVTKYKIPARKCEIREISPELNRKFVQKYHIQGAINASVRLGLFYHNHLVAVMTFSHPRFSKKYEWELLRYCTVANFSIIGGAGKLFSQFIKDHPSQSVVTYADRMWSQGGLYRQLGFELISTSEPAYFYVRDNERFSRVKFQKHKLENILEEYHPELSESENMEINGFGKVYDCGCYTFLYNK